jgi:endonuclease I
MESLMKRIALIAIWIFVICLVYGQTYHIQEGFSTTSLPTGWSGDVYFNSTANIGNLSGVNGAGFNANNKYLQTPSMNGVGTLSFWMKGSAASSAISFKVQKSVGGAAFTDLATYPKPHTTTAVEQTVVVNDNSANIVLKFVAYDRTGNSIYLDDIQVTTFSGGTPEIPPAPLVTAATNVTDSGFTANWNASSGATGYYFDLSLTSSFSSFVSGYQDYYIAATSLVIAGLAAETTYYYRVRASNSAGTSPNSNSISATTDAPDPFDGYYASADGLSGTALKNALHNIIDNNTNTNYDDAKLELFQNLDNNGGVVRCVYTGRDYTVNSTYNGSSDPNTEHTYAQSWFGTSETNIKKADLHHLFVTNMNVNSSRSNYPFDDVVYVTNTYTYANGYYSYKGTNSGGKTVFEPADQHKGNLARALMYFSVRYEMTLSQGGVDMLDTLLDWHLADPVDEAEQIRNTKVQLYQGNRNPFVDYPEFASYIWGGALPNTTVEFSPASASVSEDAVSITLNLKITNPSSSAATSAQVQLFNGDSADVGNYTTQSVTFPAGSSADRQITVNITDDSLMDGTEYFEFRIINVTGGFSAIAGNYYGFNLTILDNDIPAPLATAASDVAFTTFRVNWQPVSGVEGYLLDVSGNSDFSSFVDGYQDYFTEDASVLLSGLQSGATYYYRLRSLYNEGYSDYSNVITVQTLQIVELSAPSGLFASAISHEGFSARWNAVSGATSYQIQVYEQGGGNCADLIISEYVEGSGNNKYLEIYNGTGQSVDLGNYQLLLYSNGVSTVSTTSALSGILAHGEAKVYRNSSAVLTLPAGVTAEVAGAVNFNGDDAISLYKVSPAGHVDIFGRIGNDPGTAWTADGGYTTVDRTLARKSDVIQGVTQNPTGTGVAAFTTLGTEWDVFAVDTASGLGSHSHQGSSVLVGYNNEQTSFLVLRVSGLQSSTEYGFRVQALNSGFTGDYSELHSVNTIAENQGSGAGTAIAGMPVTIEVAALPSLSDNRVTIDPDLGANPDFSVVVAEFGEGLSYAITSSEASALNGSYTLYHEGLGYIPQGIRYRFGGELYHPALFSLGSASSGITISGIAGGKAVLTIELLQSDDTLPVELSSFNVAMGQTNQALLQWVSQSESNLLGYYVYRNTEAELGAASLQSDLIPATNTSTVQSYLFKDDLPVVGDYFYWLEYRNLDGSNGLAGPIQLRYQIQEPPVAGAPAVTMLNSIFPNPGNGVFVMDYALAKSGVVAFQIYNAKGQLVREWQSTVAAGNGRREYWDAKDARGNSCPAGIYFLKMQADRDVFLGKIVVLK